MQVYFSYRLFWKLIFINVFALVIAGCIPSTSVTSISPATVITPTVTPTLCVVPEGAIRPTVDSDTIFTIYLQSRQFIPEPDVQSGLQWLQDIPNARVHLLLQFYDFPDSTTKLYLEESDIRLLNYIPSHAWFASVPCTFSTNDPVLPAIRWIGPIYPEDKVARGLLEGEIGNWALRGEDKVVLEVTFFEDIDWDNRQQILSKHNIIVIGLVPSSDKLTIEVSKDAILPLATEDGVRWIDVAPPPPTLNEE